MARYSHLDDPNVAAHAWTRYRRLMIWMAGAAFTCSMVAGTLLYLRHPDASIHLFIAAALGIFAAVMLGTALMGLVFLSAGTGHDEAIEDLVEEEYPTP
jgi:hypothetical protein